MYVSNKVIALIYASSYNFLSRICAFIRNIAKFSEECAEIKFSPFLIFIIYRWKEIYIFCEKKIIFSENPKKKYSPKSKELGSIDLVNEKFSFFKIICVNR